MRSSPHIPSRIHISLHFSLPLLPQPLYLRASRFLLSQFCLSLSLVLFNFYFFCGAQGAAPGEHYFQKASSCIIVRIHALISWTIWQTAYAPSSLNVLHLLIKWMSHCFQCNTLNLWAFLYSNSLSRTCCRGYNDHLNKRLMSHIYLKIRQGFSFSQLFGALC